MFLSNLPHDFLITLPYLKKVGLMGLRNQLPGLTTGPIGSILLNSAASGVGLQPFFQVVKILRARNMNLANIGV